MICKRKIIAAMLVGPNVGQKKAKKRWRNARLMNIVISRKKKYCCGWILVVVCYLDDANAVVLFLFFFVCYLAGPGLARPVTVEKQLNGYNILKTKTRNKYKASTIRHKCVQTKNIILILFSNVATLSNIVFNVFIFVVVVVAPAPLKRAPIPPLPSFKPFSSAQPTLRWHLFK